MNRIATAIVFALSLATASTAFAAPQQKATAARHEKGDRKGDEKKFPMKADEFRKLVAERVGKARQHMEKHISQKNMDEDKAKALRARFDLGVAVLNRKVDEVAADGTVTKEEAKEVRELVHKMVQSERGKGHKKDKK